MLEPATIFRLSKGEARVFDESSRIRGKIGTSAELLDDRLKSVRLAGIPTFAALAVAGAGYSNCAEAQTLPSVTIESQSGEISNLAKGKEVSQGQSFELTAGLSTASMSGTGVKWFAESAFSR